MMREAIIENGVVTNIIVGHLPNSIPCSDDTEIGDLYDGTTFSKPPLLFDEAKQAKLRELQAAYSAAIAQGVSYAGATFQCDELSVARLNAVLTAVSNGWALPTGFEWVDANNVRHPADLAFLQGLANAMADNNAALFFRLRNAKDALEAATTVADVEAVTF